jgi:hypothetical protein
MLPGDVAGTVQLERGDGVIFVDDGHNAEFEQRVESCAQVGIALRIEEVVPVSNTWAVVTLK